MPGTTARAAPSPISREASWRRESLPRSNCSIISSAKSGRMVGLLKVTLSGRAMAGRIGPAAPVWISTIRPAQVMPVVGPKPRPDLSCRPHVLRDVDVVPLAPDQDLGQHH